MAKSQQIEALEALRDCECPLALSRFASSFAHELGTPLNVIAGLAAMIASGEIAGEAVVKSAKKMAEQATRMTEMIRRVIRQTELPPARKVPLVLAALLPEAVAVLSLDDAQLVVPEALAACTILADRGRILAAVVAVLENAVQANGGPVTLTLSQEVLEPPQEVAAQRGPYLCVAIADTGGGIAPERMGDIFRAFYTSKEIGTGLGLPLAQTAVREHGGFIRAESVVGQGSTFTICLPQGEKT